MLSISRTTRAAMGALLVLCTMTACSDDPTEPGAETIPIGGLFSLTGNWSTLGRASEAALELAVADINASLARGASELRFEAVVEDTKLDPAVVLTAAQSLKSAGVVIALGPQSSAEVAALKPWADANGMLVVSQSSTAGTLALANDNVLRLTPGDSLESIALAAMMTADGISSTVPLWRADAGNRGLAVQTRARMSALGATVSAGLEYGASETDFTAELATIRAEVVAAIAREGSASKVAVTLAAFDEAVQIFRAATNDPVLSSVTWYGTDGTALSAALQSDAVAAAFAARVGFANPIFGLDDSNIDKWQPIAARIRAATGEEPDAFALAVYDGAWLAAQAHLYAGGRAEAALLRTQLVQAAQTFHGATGATTLNAAGDRRNGNFDFFALRAQGAGHTWTRVAQFDTQSGVLRR